MPSCLSRTPGRASGHATRNKKRRGTSARHSTTYGVPVFTYVQVDMIDSTTIAVVLLIVQLYRYLFVFRYWVVIRMIPLRSSVLYIQHTRVLVVGATTTSSSSKIKTFHLRALKQ